MEPQDNRHLPSEDTFLKTESAHQEENILISPTPAALLKRLRLGHRSRLSEMDQTQLLTALESPEWHLRMAAVQTLEERGASAPIDRLVNALRDDHEAVRAAAAHALGVVGNPSVVGPLVEALQDTIWFVRASAVQALGRLRAGTAGEALRAALHDEDETVRATAVRALGTMGDQTSLEALRTALQDRAWQVREMAVLTLSIQAEYIPRAGLQDKDELVRRAAHVQQETSADRLAETIKCEKGSDDLLFQEDERSPWQSIQDLNPHHYPRKGRVRALRLILLACWSIFLGYPVQIVWNLLQLMHAHPTQLTDRAFFQALPVSLEALMELNIPLPLREGGILLALLLLYGCLWAIRDIWVERRWLHRHASGREEGQIAVRVRDHAGPKAVSAVSHRQVSTAHLLSRRAIMVGLSATLLIGNGIGWSLLLKSKRRSQVAGSIIQGTTLYTYQRHTAIVRSVAWSPDSRRIASGSDDKTVQVWEATNGGHPFVYHGHTLAVFTVAWSPDGKHIASAGEDGTVQICDAITGAKVFTYQGHTSARVLAIAWSPDGKHIASASNTGEVQVWNTSDGSHRFTYLHSYIVLTVAWSPDGGRIASGSKDRTVQVWEATSGRHLYTYNGHAHSELGFITAVAWSPDSTRIASGSEDSTVQVWEATSGRHLYTYNGHAHSELGFITAVAWSPDGRRIASGSKDRTVQVWDAGKGTHDFTYYRHTNAVTAIAWSPDSTRIASGSEDRTVRVWEES